MVQMTLVPNFIIKKPVWVTRIPCLTGDCRIYPLSKAPGNI